VRVGSRAPLPQKLVLDLASIAQNVTGSNAAAGVNARASGNQDAVTLDADGMAGMAVSEA